MAISSGDRSHIFHVPASTLLLHAAVIACVTAAVYFGALRSMQHGRVVLWVFIACSSLSSSLFVATRMGSESARSFAIGAGCLGFAGGLMVALSMLRNQPEPDAFLWAGVVSLAGMLVTVLLGIWNGGRRTRSSE